MRLIDVFPFCDEIDLVKIRLRYLSPIVDLFIVGEFNRSFSGIAKDYNFLNVMSTLPNELRSRILYLPIEQKYPFDNPFENDDFQKNFFIKLIESKMKSDDVIISGDCDEFPRIRTIKKGVSFLKSGFSIAHFAQKLSFGFLNLVETTDAILSFTGEYPRVLKRRWLGTVLSTKHMLHSNGFSGLRSPDLKRHGIRLNNGGWHFSACNGEGLDFQERFQIKYSYTSHQEFNKKSIVDSAIEKVREGKDPLGRNFPKRFLPGDIEPRFKRVPISTYLPRSFGDVESEYPNLVCGNKWL